MPSRPLRHELLVALTAILASSSAVHCDATVVGGGGPGGTGGGATSSTSAGTTTTTTSTSSGAGTGGTTSVSTGAGGGTASGCLKPKGTSIGIFNELTPQNPWTNPTTGLSGTLFLDPASAGSFTTGYAGMQVQYSQLEMVYGDFGSNPSFGVYFSKCVDASAFKGVTYQIYPGPSGVPAGSGGVLKVLTASTTPSPHGTCVPTSAGDCTGPYWKPSISDFGIPNEAYTITWDLLADGSPSEPGITAATEIVGLAWIIDEWEGPPPTQVQLDIFLNAVSFVPM